GALHAPHAQGDLVPFLVRRHRHPHAVGRDRVVRETDRTPRRDDLRVRRDVLHQVFLEGPRGNDLARLLVMREGLRERPGDVVERRLAPVGDDVEDEAHERLEAVRQPAPRVLAAPRLDRLDQALDVAVAAMALLDQRDPPPRRALERPRRPTPRTVSNRKTSRTTTRPAGRLTPAASVGVAVMSRRSRSRYAASIRRRTGFGSPAWW